MSDRGKLLALAEAVEKLTGPDRAVDAQIALALPMYFNAGPAYDGAPDRIGKINADGSHSIPGNAHDMLVRAYTASLDAAMTLVPEGWRLELEQHSSSWTAQLANAPWFDDRRQIVDANGPTAIIALLSSALRAQAEALP